MNVPAKTARSLLLLAALLSGVGGLVHEMVWARLLGLVFGSTALAVTTITTAFMAGLALGAVLAGPVADRSPRPARAYAILELVLAALALALPLVLAAAEGLWASVLPVVGASPLAGALARFGAGLALLALPTACMGATLPFLARQLVRSRALLGADLGLLYGVNTLGGVIGCFLAGTRLIPEWGVAVALGVGVAANLAAAALALLAAGGLTLPEAPPEAAQEPAEGLVPDRVLLPLVMASGLSFLALEVQWVRLLRFYLPATPLEAFSLVLSVCLLGLALGGLAYARVSRWLHGLRGVALLQLLLGLSGGLPYVLFALPVPPRSLGAVMVASALLFGVSSLACGLLFPLFHTLGVTTVAVLGRKVGAVYAALTVGNILGAGVAGFLLIPRLGLSGGMMACAALNLVLAGVAAVPGPAPRGRLLAGAGLGLALVLGGAVALPSHPSLHLAEGERLLWYRDGLSSSTAVIEGPGPGERALIVESIHSRIRPGSVMPEIPLALHAGAERMLLVGFGSGVNSHRAMEARPGLRLTAVELDDNQRLTAGYFERENHGVIGRPGFEFVADDGRSHLHASPPEFDVIAMDAYLFYGHLDLYGEGFTALARSRLRPGGLYCQRLSITDLSLPDFKALLATFVAVFPEASLWELGANLYMLMGSVDRFAIPARVVDGGGEALLRRFVAGPRQVAAMAEGGERITDWRPHRLIAEAHPEELGVFDPLLAANAPAQRSEIAGLIEAHRAPLAEVVEGVDPGRLRALEAERSRPAPRPAGPQPRR